MKKYYLPLIVLSIALLSCKKEGCTDPMAANYNPKATKDNGSCKILVPEDDCFGSNPERTSITP